MDDSTAPVGERPKSPRFFVAQDHYAPQNRENLRSLSHLARYEHHNPTGS